MKKSIPKVRERESEASILGNDREREFPLSPALTMANYRYLVEFYIPDTPKRPVIEII